MRLRRVNPSRGLTMATINEPAASARQRNHRMQEIISVIAFCVVMAIVFMMRNYASGG